MLSCMTKLPRTWRVGEACHILPFFFSSLSFRFTTCHFTACHFSACHTSSFEAQTGFQIQAAASLALSVESFRLLNNPYRGRMGIVRPTGQVVAVEHTGKAEPMSSVPTQVSLTLVQILTSVKSNLQKHHLQMCGIF